MVWQIAASAGLQTLGGLLGRSGAKRAAREREQGYRDAGLIVDQAYDDAGEYYTPRYEQEQAAIDRVNSLTGLGGETPNYDEFRDSPGYQFGLDERQRAIERSAAARGGLASGNTLVELGRDAQGYADQGFNNYLATILQLQSPGVDNTLAGLSVNRGNSLANLRLGSAGATAGGIEESTNALTGAIAGGASLVGSSAGNKGVRRPPVNQLPAPTSWRGVPSTSTYRGG